MITREQVLHALREHQFTQRGIELEFQLTDEIMMAHPYATNPSIQLAVMSRRITDDLIKGLIQEIEIDLSLLHVQNPEVTRYGVWLYELRPDIIRYAKATK